VRRYTKKTTGDNMKLVSTIIITLTTSAFALGEAFPLSVIKAEKRHTEYIKNVKRKTIVLIEQSKIQLINDLQKELKKQTKDGDLKSANAINEKIKELQNPSQVTQAIKAIDSKQKKTTKPKQIKLKIIPPNTTVWELDTTITSGVKKVNHIHDFSIDAIPKSARITYYINAVGLAYSTGIVILVDPDSHEHIISKWGPQVNSIEGKGLKANSPTIKEGLKIENDIGYTLTKAGKYTIKFIYMSGPNSGLIYDAEIKSL